MREFVAKIRQMFAFVSRLNNRAEHQPVNFTNIKVLLLHLCDFDEDLCQWVMRWLAYPLRNPGAKMCYAVVANGEQGTGKNLFFEQVAARLYTQDQARVIVDVQMDAVYNGWADSQFVVIDGIFTKGCAVRLKELITAESILVQRRNHTIRRRKNYMNLVFLSTSPNFLSESQSDRRWLVLECPPRRDLAFYQAVSYEIEHGGVDAFRDYLMRDLDMGSFNESTMPPQPRARKQQEAA